MNTVRKGCLIRDLPTDLFQDVPRRGEDGPHVRVEGAGCGVESVSRLWREREMRRGWEDAHGQRKSVQGLVRLGDEAFLWRCAYLSKAKSKKQLSLTLTLKNP